MNVKELEKFIVRYNIKSGSDKQARKKAADEQIK